MPVLTKFRAAVLGVAMLAAVVGVGATSSTAGAAPVPGVPITCTAAGTVNVGGPPNGLNLWNVNGVGSCFGDFGGTYIVSFTGAGTSMGRGTCGDTGVVQNLNITVAATLLNAGSGATTPVTMTWGSPVTTYPHTTPFLVNGGEGVGNFSTRVFGQCAALGAPVATFQFSFVR